MAHNTPPSEVDHIQRVHHKSCPCPLHQFVPMNLPPVMAQVLLLVLPPILIQVLVCLACNMVTQYGHILLYFQCNSKQKYLESTIARHRVFNLLVFGKMKESLQISFRKSSNGIYICRATIILGHISTECFINICRAKNQKSSLPSSYPQQQLPHIKRTIV